MERWPQVKRRTLLKKGKVLIKKLYTKSFRTLRKTLVSILFHNHHLHLWYTSASSTVLDCIDRLRFFFFSDWAAMMEVDTASHDYSPFPSKLFALLFILLLNSPRPLVCTCTFTLHLASLAFSISISLYSGMAQHAHCRE